MLVEVSHLSIICNQIPHLKRILILSCYSLVSRKRYYVCSCMATLMRHAPAHRRHYGLGFSGFRVVDGKRFIWGGGIIQWGKGLLGSHRIGGDYNVGKVSKSTTRIHQHDAYHRYLSTATVITSQSIIMPKQ